MSVLDVIQRSSEFLAAKGVDSPRLQIELMLAHVLQMPRLNLYLNFERALTASELEQVRELVKRRSRREPLQHLLGTVSFCGLELAVDARVLVPRPETELLAEHGWTWLNQLQVPNPVALDLGTGSGCLAIALAVHCPAAQVFAVDISEAALTVARGNAARHHLEERITFLAGDAFTALPAGTRCDLIVSNPPYIPTADLATLQPEVRDYDPRIALDGGGDGLLFYRRLAREAPPFLAARGQLLAELGDDQSEAVREIFQGQKWIVEAIEPDYTGRPRILTARRPGA